MKFGTLLDLTEKWRMQKKIFEKLPLSVESWSLQKMSFLLVTLQRTCLNFYWWLKIA